MLEKVRKFTVSILVLIVITMGVVMWWQKRQHANELVKLHNKIAASTETIEIHKNAYEKQSFELDNLKSVLESFEKENASDKETIKKLRKELDKRKEELVAVSRIAAKWKKAYEGVAEAEQDDPIYDDDSDEVIKEPRTRVTFHKDFGYIGVEGFTLTNPPHAWLKITQNRPLLLTIALTQAKDGHWSTYVTSSEDNVGVDVKLSAVNPYVFREKWYEKFSLDLGMDVDSVGIYPYAGLSYPIGPVYLSGGVFGDAANEGLGWYSTISYSWRPFAR